ncbi:transmembrane protease serine 9-like isoform X2 [Alosa sapidissima]|uniref:transmembrane protease serine 9-like isoform X2 n=1 Tax=Alosa sapidissima TaxID=34773 RepID=UPI001C0A13A3|nr:transmembrane protease serine 9-like isoform X2 [Alosa sapidissima]
MSIKWASPFGLLCMSVCVSVCVCERVSPTPAVLDGPGSNCPVPRPLLNGEAEITTDGETQVVEYRCHKPYTLRNATSTIYTCSEDGTWRDHENRDAPPECVPVCGRPTVSLLRHQRILGGKKAPAESVPWQVLLSGFGRGGAFVIHEQWLLTAAHNYVQPQEIKDKESLEVYVGENTITGMLKWPKLEVQAVRVHPLYNNPDDKNYDHDIALIQLKQKITFNSRVMPLCLPTTDDQYMTGRMGLVSGFGVIEKQRLLSDLRFVKLPLVEQKVCEDFASLPNVPNSITENMFCAGFPEGGKDSCTGDSGGAFAFEQDGRFWAAGIVSWGVNCGEPGYYGVYTRISKYTDWIHKIIDNQFTDCGDPKPLLNGRVTFLSITEKQYLSVIEYQCNEPYYAFQESDRVRYTCAVDGVWRDRNNSDIIPPCVPVCGRPETVKNGNVPWFVSVSVDGGKGAGSVIGNRWILTAASSLLPRGDATTTTRQVKLSINESALEVTALHIHPSYNQSDSLTYFNHNIALVKLRSLITFNADVTPLCLPTEKSDRAGLRGLVSAFPSNSSNDKGIWLPLVDHGKCNSSKPEVLSAKTLCSEGARSLLSDYMGAALGVEEDGRFGAAGVFIQTVANQEGGAYGVYTRVSQYQHWIRDTIQQHYCEHPELPNMVELVDHDIRYEQHSELQLQCASKYYSLQGEEKYTCAADGVWRSGTGHSVWPTCVPVCGITEVPLHSSARILGGRAARLGAVPWQLLMKVPYRAGASLLNDRWALTAASVVDGHTDRNLTLYGGMVDSLDSKQVVMVSEKVVIHPGYKRGLSEDELTSYDNDIALIKLSSRVRLGPTLRPVCLPERTTGSAALEGKMGTVSGFGTWEKGLRSRRLRHAPIREYAREQCAETPVHGLQQQPMAFTHNMFCAGLEATDSCQGDSGGPLVQPVVGLQRPGQLYRVKGIVSWGPVCGSKTYYTKVQNYLDWITETMEKD